MKFDTKIYHHYGTIIIEPTTTIKTTTLAAVQNQGKSNDIVRVRIFLILKIVRKRYNWKLK